MAIQLFTLGGAYAVVDETYHPPYLGTRIVKHNREGIA